MFLFYILSLNSCDELPHSYVVVLRGSLHAAIGKLRVLTTQVTHTLSRVFLGKRTAFKI